MTDKQLDWADELAVSMLGMISIVKAPEIAAALRQAFKRGEASGMRRAADIIHKAHCDLRFDEGAYRRTWIATGFIGAYEAVADEADRIEKGIGE
jgi:hypothetical protein